MVCRVIRQGGVVTLSLQISVYLDARPMLCLLECINAIFGGQFFISTTVIWIIFILKL